MIDLHCHLLPGIDDGPADIDQALALARALVADGVTHAVLTPHLLPGRWDNHRSGIADHHARLAAALKVMQIPLSTSYGGEVRLTPEVLDLLPLGELPFLDGPQGGTLRTLLLEMPDNQVPLGADKFCAALCRQGITPLIAHPERNRGVMERPERMQPFVDMGCALQLTAGSLLGEFGSRAQAAAQALLDAGWVSVVANDAHHTTRRAPRMRPARRWLRQHYGDAVAHRLLAEEPARLCGLAAPPAAQAA